MRRICRVVLAIGVAVGLAAVSSGCGGDEPERQSGIVIPDGPRDPGGDHPGSGVEEPETEPGIEGTWSDGSGKVVLTFTDPEKEESDGSGNASGTFNGRAGSGLGFHVQDIETVSGTYTYDSLRRWLWLSVAGDGEIYSLEFKCLIADDVMTLTDIGGNRTVLKKAK